MTFGERDQLQPSERDFCFCKRDPRPVRALFQVAPVILFSTHLPILHTRGTN